MIIDVFSHHVSRGVGEALKKSSYYGEGRVVPSPAQNADPEMRLELMDKYGVDVQVLTQTTPILLGLDAREAAEICRISNDDNYALCKTYPKRFVNVGIISLLDMKSAMKELERCIKDLDCRGLTIASNQNGNGLDSVDYYLFYEKMVEYDLPIWIHPTHWESYPLVSGNEKWRMMSVFGWPFDTTQAVWRMIFGGVLDRFPTLKIVTHHLGGMIPFFSRRAEMAIRESWGGQTKKRLTEYWENIYGDTAVSGTRAAFPCGYAFFGPDRMMYGTDYPFGPETGEDFVRENLAGIKEMQISQGDKKKILGENAKKLLKIR